MVVTIIAVGMWLTQGVPWFQVVLANGVKDYFDIWNTHYYGDVNGPSA